MQTARTLASLFEELPRQWGLRGDPHLWQEMKATLGNAAYPATEKWRLTCVDEAVGDTRRHGVALARTHIGLRQDVACWASCQPSEAKLFDISP